MRPSHALAAAFVVLLALVLWLVNVGEPPPDAGPIETKAPAEPAAVETSGNKRSLVEDASPKAAPAAAPAAGSSQPASPTGNLHVVVHNERGNAIPECTVSAAEHDGRTDATGNVTLTVAAGRTFVSVNPPAGSPLRGRSGWQTVRAGSTTELTIVLAPATNIQFWAQLVAAEDGKALPGVELSVHVHPNPLLMRSDAEGFAPVEIADDDAWVDARDGGRCQCRIVPEPGHESRATALRVPLAKGATLAVQVVDAAEAPVADVTVELRLNAWELQFPPGSRGRGDAFVWRASSDLSGRLTIADLPIGITLQVKTRAAASFAAFAEERWVLSSPEEERRIVLVPASGVHGKVTDDSGAPVAGVTVQANVPDGRSRPRVLGTAKEPHRTTTASDGTFRLGGLGADHWWIGIPYDGRHQPTSVSVQVPPVASVEVDLRATAGLPVAGRAFAPDGKAAVGLMLELHIDDTFVGGAKTDAEGRFRFANLPAGSCELRSEPFETDLGLPERVTIEAGDENVELRLLAVNGSIAGRIVGSDDAWVTAYRRDSHAVFGMRCELDGSFCYRGLRGGTWDLHAMDRKGRAACVAGVQVLGGRETAGVLLDLQAAAKIAPRHREADEFVVRNGEHVASIDNLEPGAAGEARVPPGTWTVVFLLRGKEVSRREVTVRPGEERIVDGDR